MAESDEPKLAQARRLAAELRACLSEVDGCSGEIDDALLFVESSLGTLHKASLGELLTREQVESRYDISRPTLYIWLKGDFPRPRITQGQRVYWALSDLLEEERRDPDLLLPPKERREKRVRAGREEASQKRDRAWESPRKKAR